MNRGNPYENLPPAERELLTRRREIAVAAVEIADEEGIDAVSMRNIATRLGVGTMTLYSWVEGKDDLIAAMSDVLSEGLLVPEPLPDDWREALTLIAVAARDTFAAHPWMLSRPRSRRRVGANMLRHIDQSLRAVRSLDLDPQTRSGVLQAVDHYALGYALANQRRREAVPAPDYGQAFKNVAQDRAKLARDTTGAEPTRGDAAAEAELRAMFESGEAPLLEEYFGSAEQAVERVMHGPPRVDEDFELGLTWLLDGVATMLERAR